jgi:parvulin-like peptidyl-prolyl isomerase
MAGSKFPEEADKTTYQRDKAAKEPVKPEKTPKAKPKPKPRKLFVPKKLVRKSNKPQEYRVRNIRISTLDTANLFRQTLLEYQLELAEEPMDNPDKLFHDREKLENYFSRIAKKYSICSTRKLGGNMGWVYEGMKIQEEIMTKDLVSTMLNTEKYIISEPIRTRLGYHLILVCEQRDQVKGEKSSDPLKPKNPPPGTSTPT